MRPVQHWARHNRIRFFLPFLRPECRVLEIGPGEGWFRNAIEPALRLAYTSIDSVAPADIHGDIRNWREYGLEADSFDAIIAFEVVEHVDCFRECHELLKPDGLLLITTPMPHMDWALKLAEALRLTQKRTSPHSNLIYLDTISGFTILRSQQPFGVGQWAVMQKLRE